MSLRCAGALLAAGACGANMQVIDRIEGDRAVLVDQSGRVAVRPRSELPAGARESDCLVEGRVDRAACERARQRIRDIRARLLRDDGEDFALGPER